MLTDTDFKRIQKLVLNLATKDDLQRIEERLSRVEKSLHSLNVSVDRFVKIVADLQQEHVAINSQLTRHEEWIKEIARKTGVSLKF